LIIINVLENKKIQKVKEILSGKKVVIAFSGGVDSSLAAFFAKKFANDAYTVTIKSEFISEDEVTDAKRVASELGIDWQVINLDILIDPKIKDNPPDRCYLCKKNIILTLQQIKKMENFDLIIDGTNADDLNEERPGLLALKESDVRSPLAEAGFTKDEIRKFAKEFKLSSWKKPSMPCIATRFPHFHELKMKEIEMVQKAEKFIRSEYDINILRVRIEFLNARIEVGVDEIEKLLNLEVIKRISNTLKELGFNQVTLDLEGYKTS